MKKILFSLGFCFLLSSGVSLAATPAFQWAFDNDLIPSPTYYTPNTKITREQFAPILLKYIKNIAKKDYIPHSCKARDLHIANHIYRDDLNTLCSYGILNGERGSLYPLRKLTNGQVVALILRIMDSIQNESTVGGRHRAQGYYDRAIKLGFDTSKILFPKDSPITYENLIEFLYSTRKDNSTISKKNSSRSTDDPLKKLSDIMHYSPNSTENFYSPAPECNPFYDGQRLSSLSNNYNLCKVGNLANFSSSNIGWNWECQDDNASRRISCSAQKRYSSSTNSTPVREPKCNPAYNNKTFSNLSTAYGLCNYGEIRNFNTNINGRSRECYQADSSSLAVFCKADKTPIKGSDYSNGKLPFKIDLYKAGWEFDTTHDSNKKNQYTKEMEVGYYSNPTKKGWIKDPRYLQFSLENGYLYVNGNRWGATYNGGISSLNDLCGSTTEAGDDQDFPSVTIGEECFDTINAGDGLTISKAKPGCILEYTNDRKTRTLKIPDTIQNQKVTHIGTGAFASIFLVDLSLVIPEGVKSIGQSAFKMMAIDSIVLPKSLKSIGEDAFIYNCLKEVVLPDTVETIEHSAFSNNELIKVKLPTNLTEIGQDNFAKNYLASIDFPERIKRIGSGAFSQNYLSDITLPKSLEEIGRSAFYTNKLTSIKLPDSIKSIGELSFANNLLKSVDLGQSIERIGASAFAHNKFPSNYEGMIIPHSLKSIGDQKTITPPYPGILGIVSSEDRKNEIQNYDPSFRIVVHRLP